MIMPRSAFPFQYGSHLAPTRSGYVHQARKSAATLSRLSRLSGYGQDEWQPLTFDPQTGAESGTGITPTDYTPSDGGGGGGIPYYLAKPGTPSDQIDWSTYHTDTTPPSGGGGGTYTSGGDSGGGASSFFTNLLSGLFKSVGAAAQPPRPPVMQQQQQGIPTWAIVLGGIGAVGVVAILLKK
jgi:hypothetical protein